MFIRRDARIVLSGPGYARIHTAVALLVKGPVSRVHANYFMGLNRPPMPCQAFDDVQAARA